MIPAITHSPTYPDYKDTIFVMMPLPSPGIFINIMEIIYGVISSRKRMPMPVIGHTPGADLRRLVHMPEGGTDMGDKGKKDKGKKEQRKKAQLNPKEKRKSKKEKKNQVPSAV
ncbi:MAG: hypothetical protein AVO38_05550 [delta proteobacterium ML8_D]|jgi:hypothetical protein|nr:MAG: hypothetical protein AVO38_05550 [delta proteobacterium ML8_D]